MFMVDFMTKALLKLFEKLIVRPNFELKVNGRQFIFQGLMPIQ